MEQFLCLSASILSAEIRLYKKEENGPMLASTTNASTRTSSAILRTAHPFCATPRFQTVVLSRSTTNSHQNVELDKASFERYITIG